MKIKISKQSVLTLFVFICLTLGYSQSTYLKITTSIKAYDYEMYPPGTNFELKDSKGLVVFRNSDNPGFIEINEKHTLYVYPSWKSTADVFVIDKGRIDRLSTKVYGESDKTKTPTSYNGVTAKKQLSDSNKFEYLKNVVFSLSNGIQFEYTDGNYRATLDNKELIIKGKYLIYSKLGVLKLSFNPKNGVIWWVFEPHK